MSAETARLDLVQGFAAALYGEFGEGADGDHITRAELRQWIADWLEAERQRDGGDPLRMDEAWAVVEATLPKTWYISNVRRRSLKGRYSASATLAYSDTGESMVGFGPTVVDALLALAKRLSEPPFTPPTPDAP